MNNERVRGLLLETRLDRQTDDSNLSDTCGSGPAGSTNFSHDGAGNNTNFTSNPTIYNDDSRVTDPPRLVERPRRGVISISFTSLPTYGCAPLDVLDPLLLRGHTPDQVLQEIVQPALAALTKPGEVTSMKAWERPDGIVEVGLEFGGESFNFYAWQPDASIQGRTWLGKFASDLQDFIAESRLAWGTLRTYPDEWGS